MAKTSPAPSTGRGFVLASPPPNRHNCPATIHMNTSFLETADWTVIVLYLLGIIGLGLWFGKDQKNTRDYFLGSRNTPWWGIGFSIVAAETSALTIISVPAMAYGGNVAFIQIIIGYVIARILLAIVMVPHYLKGEIYSPYQLLQEAFGISARRTAGGMFLVSETLAAGVRVYVASIPIQIMFGPDLLSIGTGDPILGAILLFIILSLVYTYIGGVKAVIWTDAVQFLLFLAGGLFTIAFIPTLIEGGWTEVWARAQEAGKLQWFNGTFSLAAPNNSFNIWMGVIGGTFVVLSSHGAEQLIVQRVLACGSVADGRKALVLSAIMILPLFAVFLLVGVLLYVYYLQAPMAIPIPESRPGIKKNDFIYPIFMVTAVPTILRGFLIVSILSAAMSSVSSALTSLASVFTMDFYKPMTRQPRDESHFLKVSKLSTVGWALVLVLVAYLSREVEYVLNAAFKLRGLTSGALLGGLLAVLMFRHGRAFPVVAGMVASLLAMIAVSQISWETLVDGKRTEVTIAWPWFTLIGTAVTLATTWLVAKASGVNPQKP